MRVLFEQLGKDIGYIDWDGETMTRTIPDNLWNRLAEEGVEQREWDKDLEELKRSGPFFPKDGVDFLTALPNAYRNAYLWAQIQTEGV